MPPTPPISARDSLDLDRVTLIRKENGGKPSALNAGIALARYELLVLVDGDTVFRPNTLRELVKPFADPDIGAVSGNTKVVNRDGLLGSWQHLEYVMGFNLDRRMFDVLECMPTVPGAIGAFRRAALDRVGESVTTHWPRTPTSRWRCAATAGGWSTHPTRWRRPKRPQRFPSCGASGTAGVTELCSRCGSTVTP
jgi:cellulose synthase/poly-beta-1,6-N-acetylglucosamine synthase-like glycosyltransferase